MDRNALAGNDDSQLLGAEPTGRYAHEQMLRDYTGAGLSGANALGAGTLAAIMAADPSWLVRIFGTPAMGMLALGMGKESMKLGERGNQYRRYRNEQTD